MSGTTRDTATGRTARLHLSARFTGGLRPTQARLVTRVQPERTAVGRVGTPHAADDRIPRRACVAKRRTFSSKTTTCLEEGVLRSSRKADGGSRVSEERVLCAAPGCRRAVDVAGGRRDAARRAAWRVPTRPTAARSGWTRVTRQACVGLSPSVNRADNCGRAVRRGAACRARPWHSVDPAREHTCLRQSALSLPGWRRVPRVR